MGPTRRKPFGRSAFLVPRLPNLGEPQTVVTGRTRARGILPTIEARFGPSRGTNPTRQSIRGLGNGKGRGGRSWEPRTPVASSTSKAGSLTPLGIPRPRNAPNAGGFATPGPGEGYPSAEAASSARYRKRGDRGNLPNTFDWTGSGLNWPPDRLECGARDSALPEKRCMR